MSIVFFAVGAGLSTLVFVVPRFATETIPACVATFWVTELLSHPFTERRFVLFHELPNEAESRVRGIEAQIEVVGMSRNYGFGRGVRARLPPGCRFRLIGSR